MSEYLSPTTSMVIGALIGIILLTTLIIVICTFSLEGRRKESKSAGQNDKKRQDINPQQGLSGGNSNTPPREKPGRIEKIKPVKPQKPLKEKATRPDTQKAAGGFQLFGPKINSGNPKPIKQKPVKQTPTPKSEVKEPAQTAKIPEQGSPPTKTEQSKGGFFGNKKSAVAKEESKKTIPTQVRPNSPPITGGVSVETVSPPVAAASEAPPSQPAGTVPPVAAETKAAVPEPEKSSEENTDSIFSLFNDTSGEESEISKFASNFDDVSLDSLLGDSQVILERLIKE